jgi:hypothetical protein
MVDRGYIHYIYLANTTFSNEGTIRASGAENKNNFPIGGSQKRQGFMRNVQESPRVNVAAPFFAESLRHSSAGTLAVKCILFNTMQLHFTGR